MKTLIISFSVILFMGVTAEAFERATEERLDQVEKRGAQIMPFSLERTTHIFSKTETGGLQQVIAKDRSDSEQIGLIRGHLSRIAREFRRGDFFDPARIHGEGMPGLAKLRSATPGRIRIVCRELADGAEIAYSTDDPKLVAAIHQWFDAQLSDHARHASPGHPHHQMHVKPSQELAE